MSLQILIAHTGERLDADPLGFNSLDAFKAWVEKATSIPSPDQILLTNRAKHVKLQALLLEKEIFLYDRDLFSLSDSQSPSAIIPPVPIPDFSPAPPPATTNPTDLRGWQSLFKQRRDWALDLLDRARSMAKAAEQHFDGRVIIERGVRVAGGNHEGHLKNLGQRHQGALKWIQDLRKDQEAKAWERDYASLKSVPAKREFMSFMAYVAPPMQKESRRASPADATTLQSFVDPDALRKAASLSRRTTDNLDVRIREVGSMVERISADYNQLLESLNQSQSRSAAEDEEEPFKLLSEVEAVAKKIASDYEHVMGLSAGAASQIAKMALLHFRNFIPGLEEYSVEMNELLRRAIDQKNAAIFKGVQDLQAIASIESTIQNAKAELKSVEEHSEGLDAVYMLNWVSKLPVVYGDLLAEAVRRLEWAEKLKSDSTTLAEEMAGYQEEEERRRKRWETDMTGIVNTDSVRGKTLSFEISVRGEEQEWPRVSRAELQEYLGQLQAVEGFEASAASVQEAIKELSAPTKRQVKHAKNFKKGSLHEAAFGRTSLYLRGEDENRVLREANSKLDEELRSYKSRVRKLEDLVHRSSQSRLSIGDAFPPPSAHGPDQPVIQHPSAVSPRLRDDLSRRSSVSSRRFSSNNAVEEKALSRKILELEAALSLERGLRANAEVDAGAREKASEDLIRQIEETNSTKKDLMENMEAAQREFQEERKALEDELGRHKNRLEEVEDELERILGSRDNERVGTDNRLQSLGHELAQVRKDADDEIHSAQDQVRKMQKKLNKRDAEDIDRRNNLVAAYVHLAGEEPPSDDLAQLTADLETLTQRSKDHAKDLEQAIAMARSENEALQRTQESKTAEVAAKDAEAAAKAESQEKEVSKLREELESEQGRAASLREELADERAHLRDLREKFAEGETGSEALRKRVTEEEAKVERLSAELASAKSHINSLDIELMAVEKKHAKLQRHADSDGARWRDRSARAKEISQRVYTQNEKLLRLLETLGYVVGYQDDKMVVQRASKVGASAVLPDGSASMKGSIAMSPAAKVAEEGSVDLSFLQWADAEDGDEEAARFAALAKNLSRLDLTTFSEAVLKRLKDFEHTARKWQKEAKAYRDKSHRHQSDAHDKIAFRGFKEGDLALFLPTRNNATRPWAAFNVGAPHYFLREQESHRLATKEWLVARISKVEERVVDLSRTLQPRHNSNNHHGGSSNNNNNNNNNDARSDGAASADDDNPFDLSDGLRWYLLDAAEEKHGAPSTPGLGKTTVASARVDATGSSIRTTAAPSAVGKKLPLLSAGGGGDSSASRTLHRSLESRRSSGNSRKGVAPAAAAVAVAKQGSSEALSDGGGGAPADGPGAGARGPSHLRASSDVSGRTTQPPPPPAVWRNSSGGNADGAANNDEHANGTPRSPPPPAEPGTARPPPQSAPGSPSKQRQRQQRGGAGGMWDSLWQLDISVGRGGRGARAAE